MNHFECLKRGRNVIIEMLEDRHFIVPKEFKNINDETLKHLYYIDKFDIFCKHETNESKIYVKFCNYSRIKPTIIKEYLETIFSNSLDKLKDTLILILAEEPTNTIQKILNKYNCETFSIDKIQINITKHVLVPIHQLATDEEVNELKRKYNLKSELQLPLISKNDSVIRYYNFPTNKVCKIIRPSKTSIKQVYYRYIR